MESQSRTLAKTISWRILASLITSAVVWQITGKIELGLSIATLDCLIKLVTYYLHERAWNSISFGYQNQPRNQLVNVDVNGVVNQQNSLYDLG